MPFISWGELPRTTFKPSYVTRTGTVHTVNAGGNLQAALDAAQPGDVIVLQTGAVFVGKFTLPSKSGGVNDIYVVSGDVHAGVFPFPEGRRATSSVGQAIIRDDGSSEFTPTIQMTGNGRTGWRFVGITIDHVPVSVVTALNVFFRGGSNPTEPILSNYPGRIYFDRCRVLGQPLLNCRRGLWFLGPESGVADSQILNVHSFVPTGDAQGVLFWNAVVTGTVYNCEIAGPSQPVMFGGLDFNPYALTNVPTDVTIERCWLHALDYQNPNHPSYNGLDNNTKVGGIETKAGKRIYVKDCVVSNHLGRDQQNTFVIKSNELGAQAAQNTADVVIQNVKMIDVMGGILLKGWDDNPDVSGLNRIVMTNCALIGARETSTITPRIMDYGGFMRNIHLDKITAILTDPDSAIASTQWQSPEIRADIKVTDSILGGAFGFGIAGDPYFGLDRPNISGVCQIDGCVVVSGVDTTYPTFGTNLRVATSAGVGFTSYANTSADNLKLSASSPFRGINGGIDPGCDIDVLNTATAGCFTGVWSTAAVPLTLNFSVASLPAVQVTMSQSGVPLPGPANLSALPTAIASSALTRRFPDWATAKSLRDGPVGTSITSEADGKVRLTKVAVNYNHPYSGSYVSGRDGDSYYVLVTPWLSGNVQCLKYTLGGVSTILPSWGLTTFDGGILSRNPLEPRAGYCLTSDTNTVSLWKVSDVNTPTTTRTIMKVFTRAQMKADGSLSGLQLLPNALAMENTGRYFTFTTFPQPGGGGTPNTIVLYDSVLDVVRAWLPSDIPFRADMVNGGGNGFQASGFNKKGTAMFASDGADEQACVYSIANNVWSQRYVRDSNNQPQDAGQPKVYIGHSSLGYLGVITQSGLSLARVEPPDSFGANAIPSWITFEPTRSPLLDHAASHFGDAAGLANGDGTNEWVLMSYYGRTFGQPNVGLIGWAADVRPNGDVILSSTVRTPAGAIPATIPPYDTGRYVVQASLSALQAASGNHIFYDSGTGTIHVRTTPGNLPLTILSTVLDFWTDVRSGPTSTLRATHVPTFAWTNEGSGVYSVPLYAPEGYQRSTQGVVGVAFGRSIDVTTPVAGGGTAPPGSSMTYDLTMTRKTSVAQLTGDYEWYTNETRLYVRLNGGRAPLSSDVIEPWYAVPNGATLPLLWLRYGSTEQRFAGNTYSLWNSGLIFEGDLYWITPRAASSPDGRVVVFGSNLGQCLRGNSTMPINLMVAEMPSTESAPTLDVSFVATRLSAGSGATLCTGLIPLAPGDFYPGEPCLVELGAQEVAANVTEVGNRHADGSLQAIRVQISVTLNQGEERSGSVRLRGNPALAAPSYIAPTIVTMTSTSWQSQTPVAGMLICTDSPRICNSKLLGLVASRPDPVPASPTWRATIESRFDSVHNAKWSQYDGNAAFGGYAQYDPVYQNLVRWARTGSVSAFIQAAKVWGVRRSVYWESNAFAIPEYIMHQQGLAAISLLLDDSAQRAGHLIRTRNQYCSETGYSWVQTSVVTSDVADARTCASIIWMLIACDRMGDGAVVEGGHTIREWIRLWTLRTIAKSAWVSEATGQKSYKIPADPPGFAGAGTPPWSNNFMTALLCDVLSVVHDEYLTDPVEQGSVRTCITEAMEWLWSTQFFPAGSPSPYFSLADRAVTGYASSFPEPAVDLSGLFLGPTMWLADNVDSGLWQTRADLLFDVIARSPMDGGNGPYMDPATLPIVTQKVCNETFFLMAPSLARRF